MSKPGEPYGEDRSGSAGAGTGDVGEVAHQARERVRHEAGRIGEEAKQRVRSFAEERKSVAADQVRGIADVLHQTSEGLREQRYGMVGDIADRAAQRLDDFAETMRDRDLDSMIADVGDFARRQPALFIGGAVALGFALSRFLKASSDRTADRYGEEYRQRYGQHYDDDYEDRAGYRYGREFGNEHGYGTGSQRSDFRPGTYAEPGRTGAGMERPIPSTTTSGSGATTAATTGTGAESSPGASRTSTTPGGSSSSSGGSHGGQ